MKWRMEQQQAATNLGVLLFEQRKFNEATAQFTRAMQSIKGLATADPDNADYAKALTESQIWTADALEAEGRLQEATALREEHVSLLSRLLAQTGDVEYRQKLVPAERSLGDLYAARGQLEEALKHTRLAVANSDALIAHEPDNSRWRFFSSTAHLNLARQLLAEGKQSEAANEAAAGCTAIERILAQDPSVQWWRANHRDCMIVRAQLSLRGGDLQQSLGFAERAVESAKSVKTTDPAADLFATATAYRVLGDVRQKLGDSRGAQAMWTAGLQTIPAGTAEKPQEMISYVVLLQRLGRVSEVQQRIRWLRSAGYVIPQS
jgi:tetratricopeptide (TPR) repeat protein